MTHVASRKDSQTWAASPPIAGELERAEKERILAPLGSLGDSREYLDRYAIEAIGVLLWALRMHPEPPEFDLTTISPELMIAILRQVETGFATNLLRSCEEIQAYRTRGHLIEICLFEIRKGRCAPDSPLAPEIIDGFVRNFVHFRPRDLAEARRAVGAVRSDQISQFLQPWRSRFQALDWLCGFNETFWRDPDA